MRRLTNGYGADALMVVRMGDVTVKARRSVLSRLPLLRDIMQECGVRHRRFLDLGSTSQQAWMLRHAHRWASTPSTRYVLPDGHEDADDVRRALRFFMVSDDVVTGLHSVPELLQERNDTRTKIDATIRMIDRICADDDEHVAVLGSDCPFATIISANISLLRTIKSVLAG